MGVALEVERHPHLEMLGFLDDDLAKLGLVIAGYSVLGACGMALDLVRRHEISGVIVTVQSWSNEQTADLLKRGPVAGAKVHVIPTLDQILGPKAGGAERPSPVQWNSPKTGVS